MVLKPRGLQAVLETFGSETTFIERLGGSRKLGDYVKRIDILLEGNYPLDPSTLLQLCRLTPNLVVLTTPPFRGELETLFSDETVIPHLRYLHATIERGILTRMPLNFLASHRSLRLYAPPRFENPTQEGPQDIWASIQELIFPCQPSYSDGYPSVRTFITPEFPAGTFPNLHTVVFLHNESPLAFDSFLATHGKSLRTIHVQVDRCFTRRLFETLTKCCPVLHEILYSVNPTGLDVDDDDKPVPMPGITTVGFQPVAHQLTKYERKEFFDDILFWTPKLFPNVRTIRIFSEAIILHFQRCHTKGFNSFLESCNSLGIRVEDHFREPLNSPRLLPNEPMDADPA
ncbi:hypothetical protein H1R20_g10012, partial [Candolleomyces eurysporus]